MAFELPKLPYSLDALAPAISAETLDYHYGKHHKTYVDNLNKLTEGTPHATAALETVIKNSEGGLFNNAAQVWNHTFYWHCLTPQKGTAPKHDFLKALETNFGSVDAFKTKFTEVAVKTFGSGWAWLVKNPDNKLELMSTSNAATPITGDNKPLLTCDVWEHAYYIDYRNARPKYLEHFWQVVNWDYANELYHQ